MPEPVSAQQAKKSDEEAFGEEQVPTSRRKRILELAVTVLLARAALLSAWCAYEASRFSGEQGTANTDAAALRIDSAKAESRAGQLQLVDTVTFGQYVAAVAARDGRLAEFARQRLRDEFRPAFDAWLALEPLSNLDAPKTPFTMSAYTLASSERADALAAEAEARTTEDEDAGPTSDRYVLAIVLLVAGLFLLGVQSRIGEFWLRAGSSSWPRPSWSERPRGC